MQARLLSASASVVCLLTGMGGALPVHAQAEAGATAAALVLENGRVRTPDGVREAIAVDARGLILAIGSDDEIARHKAGARVIDLDGRTVLPGLHDMHVHAISGGARQQQCRIPPGAEMSVLLDTVKACASQRPAGEWIVGGAWDVPALGQEPHRELLDAVAPDHPVLLVDTSGHNRWANSAALAAAGIDATTPDPQDGIIERGPDGAPSGVLRESANNLIYSKVPPMTVEQLQTALRWALDEMLSYGITSFTEASVGITAGWERELAAWAAVADAGGLAQRAQLCLTYRNLEPERGEAMLLARNAFERDRLTLDCVKLYLDGVPTDAHTAAMLDPYVGSEGHDEPDYGMLRIEQGPLDDFLVRFDAMGLEVKMHAAGDASVRAGLNAIERAREVNGFGGLMHSVAHSTFVTVEDLPRARRIGATLDVSPYLWGPAPINDSIAAAVGEERIARVWPVREMLDAGALVVAGSDWPIIPTVNPWIGIETMVTRERPGGSADSFGKREAATLEEAIAIYTVNAARQKGDSNRVGALSPGMIADMIVVERDPFDVPVGEIHETTVDLTIIGGDIAFER